MEYKPDKNKEMSAIETNSGGLYHLKGSYSVNPDSKSKVLPVNRSYSPNESGDRIYQETNKKYQKDKLIHEEVKRDDILKDSELLVNIYGKDLLFLDSSNIKKIISPDPSKNDQISTPAKNIIDILSKDINERRLNDSILVGVFGSQQLGLQHPKSDIDLIVWADWDSVDDVRSILAGNLREHGYVSIDDTSKLEKYAKRYSEKLQIPYLAGLYLAKKRNRWIDKKGVPISVQILNKSYDHASANFFLEGVNKDYLLRKVRLNCKILAADQVYNFPRLWKLEYAGKIITAVSFSWAHQGMGDDNHTLGDEYVFDGYLVENDNGEFLYLKDENNYILPKKLL